jgi:hypothetical protein
MDWWRCWHGAATDPKWLTIARKASVKPGLVQAIWFTLLDHASQALDRGDVSGFDVETYADFSGFEETDIRAVLDALKDKGVIADGRITNWNKRQKDDYSTERVREHRERKKRFETDETPRSDVKRMKRNETLGNAEEIREEESRGEQTRLKLNEPPRQEPARAKSSVVVEKVAPEAQHLLDRLFAAANHHVDLSDDRATKIGPISDLQNEGCDLELDILPIIKAHVPRMSTPLKSWGAPFLANHIRAARDRRKNAPPPPRKHTHRIEPIPQNMEPHHAAWDRDELIAGLIVGNIKWTQDMGVYPSEAEIARVRAEL